jgi:hypothetical protein
LSQLQSDHRWPGLKDRPNQAGAAFNASFDQMGDMLEWSKDQDDFRTTVWGDQVVRHDSAVALNGSSYAPAAALFPSVMVSNYAHNYNTALDSGSDLTFPANWAYHFNEARHSVVSSGTHVGTHQCHSLYGRSNTTQFLTASTPFQRILVAASAYTSLIMDTRLVRNMVAGNQHVPAMP